MENKKGDILSKVQRIGDKIPSPVTLFAIMAVFLVLLSGIGEAFGWKTAGYLYDAASKEMTLQTVSVISLCNLKGLIYMMENVVKTFIGYAPLGVVLVLTMSIAIADGSGFLAEITRRIVRVAPKKLICPIIIFLGINFNILSNAGTIILLPIAAILFRAHGRHPIAGIMNAWVGCSAGFAANLLLTDSDVVFSSMSTQAAQIIYPDYVVAPTSNWFFFFASVFVLTAICTFVSERFIEPMLGKFDSSETEEPELEISTQYTKRDRLALNVALSLFFGILSLLLVMALPQDSWLRNPETGSLLVNSVLMKALVAIVAIVFVIPSMAFGFIKGTFKSEKDVVRSIYRALETCIPFVAMAFTASQFINYFSYTNFATMLAICGANILSSINMPRILLLVLFILFVTLLNFFMPAASAKWSMFAPLFIPMFIYMGITPELTQVAFRIADSSTNIMSPLNGMLPFMLAVSVKYKKDYGMGTHIAFMAPYTCAILIGWIAMFVLWILFNIPIGPGVNAFI